MALSFGSYLPRHQDDAGKFTVGGEREEEVVLKANEEVFTNSGHLLGHARFSVDKQTHLFTLHWPCLQAKYATILSRWRLVITKATDDRIVSFCRGTAENLGSNTWDVVKQVVTDCKSKFDARLLSMSCREIVFAHSDAQKAEKMKNSNEMVDIMNQLLADVEYSFRDILVDWDVSVTPVTVSLTYLPQFQGQGQGEGPDSVLLTDAGSPPAGNSAASRTSVENHVLPPELRNLFDLMLAEQRKTQDAVHKLAIENSKRHRFLCHKIEELKSTVRQMQQKVGLGDGEGEKEGQSEQESDFNDATQTEDTGAEDEETIPSARLFESDRGPFFRDQDSRHNVGSHGRKHSRDSQRDSFGHKKDEDPPPKNGKTDRERQPSPPPFASEQHGIFTDSAKPSETFKDTPLSGSDLENHHLDEAVERAYLEDEIPASRAKSYYTVLCLDVSESMKDNGAFDQMVDVVHRFIDGVEDVVNETGVEENIGVVTFGGTSTVVQNLTNDFSRVRDAVDSIELGGKSPFVQALLVSMAAFVQKAVVISVGRVYDVKPRIIFISDGLPTENINEPGLDVPSNKMHVRTSLTRLMLKFASEEKYAKVHPVIYVPVGNNPDRELMKSIAAVSKGVYMEPTDIEKLCGYFMCQETIGKTLACMKGNADYAEDRIEALATSLMPGISAEQKAFVVKTVQQERENPAMKVQSPRGVSNMEDMFEDSGKVNAGDLLPLGTRVLRGPDWRWADQDSNGPGTVYSHSDKRGWTSVAWDNGNSNRYAYGPTMGYHIWKTDNHPRYMTDDGDLKLGMTVEKGPDWDSNESSRQERLKDARTGVVIRKSRSNKKLMVRWNNGEMQVVRWGADDKYDISYCDPEKAREESVEYGTEKFYKPGSAQSKPTPPPNQHTSPGAATASSPPCTPEFEHGRWQWKNSDGKWVDFAPDINDYIEKQYKKRPGGTCVINRDQKYRRVMFKRMTEKVTDGGQETAVQRIPV